MRRIIKKVGGAGLLVVLCATFLAGAVQSQAAISPAVTGTNAAAPTKTIAPVQVNLPPVAAEVLRMSEAGVSDDLITSYIQKSANTYVLSSDQIIYLHDMGISSAVLEALVNHSPTASAGPAAEASSGTTGVENGPANEAAAAAAQTAPPVTGPAATFYDSLTPYGTWVDVPAYGWCWQPAVVVVNPAWQPYCNNGCWLWTDQGWYWNSYYSWGWAPFHYGRWCQYPGYGWLWCPGSVWGPAWVCWRDYPGYCGWAPLPPGAYFTAGIGWTFNGAAVGFDFGFGLGPNCFTFCDFDHFADRRPFDHFHHGREAGRFFHGSRVNNDFAFDAHHRFINRGIAPSRIEAATHTRIPQVAVRELPGTAGRAEGMMMPDRLSRSGNAEVIYRPDRNISVPRHFFVKDRNAQMADQWRGFLATPGFTDGRAFGHSARVQTVRPDIQFRPTPGSALNYPNPRSLDGHWGRAGNFQMRRSLPTPAYRPDFSYVPRTAPAWHSAPSYSWRNAPVREAPRVFSRPAPSFGGNRFGGAARFGGGMPAGRGAAHFGGGRPSGPGGRR